MRTVTIAGGGLAGLSLGIALRGNDVPVTISEGGSYPRHRVCGEFITGINEAALTSLGIQDVMADALSLSSLSWYSGDECVLQKTLPRKAWGLSRWYLDKALADRFEILGGKLQSGHRISRKKTESEGIAWATGRTPASGAGRLRWIGLKVHLDGLSQREDLELHMGRRGYAGLSRIEGGKLNLCGLFQHKRGIEGKGAGLLRQYLEENGLHQLARRIDRADLVESSFCAVVGMDYGLLTRPQRGFVLGDNWALIPPFTGNGMSMAFESALIATSPLVQWASGGCDWRTAERAYRRQVNLNLRGRVLRARLLHGLLLPSLPRKILASLARNDSLPFRALYALTH